MIKRIALAGLMHDNNLGDPLLYDCVEYLIRRSCRTSVQTKRLDIYARNVDDKRYIESYPEIQKSRIKEFVKQGVKLILREHGFRALLWKLDYEKKKKAICRYYESELQNIDLIIIVGGGIIRMKERSDFGPYFKVLYEYAQRYRIPVVMTGAGVENKYNYKDYRCRRFSEILSNRYSRYVTTRDCNTDELKEYIRNPDVKIAAIADAGTWASEAFSIERDLNSDIVGIGVIAAERFVEYKRGISIEQYEAEIVRIVQQLEDRGEKWKLFTNGCTADNITAVNICKRLGKEPEAILLVPTTPRELVETVSKFKGIITSRLGGSLL